MSSGAWLPSWALAYEFDIYLRGPDPTVFEETA